MQASEFINQLALLYPLEQKDIEITKKILNVYVEHVVRFVTNSSKKYDLDKVLTYIQSHYKYRQMPTIPAILEYLPHGEVFPQASYSGQEGQTIKRVVNGHEYEFTVVPNHWEGVNTVQELNRDIARRNAREVI